jgi:hypothetical protein
MTRFVSGVTGLIGGVALVVAGSAIDLHAQRGAAAGHGRPATPGAQGQAHRPDTTGAATEHGKNTQSTTTTGTAGQSRVSQQLAHNTNLASRLQSLFPAGTDLQQESTGFRNLGQFVAAAHVSHNLDIPWTDLKTKMTGDHPESLGKAISELKPAADAKTEAAKAAQEASDDMKNSTPPSTSTTTATKQ